MKRLFLHFNCSLLILIYYTVCILDSALSDNQRLVIQGINPELNEAVNQAEVNNAKAAEEIGKLENIVEEENVLNGSLQAEEFSGNMKVLVEPSNPSKHTKVPPPFSEITSNNKISNGVINDTPIILSMEDIATKELQEKATLQHAEIVTQSQVALDSEKTQSPSDSNTTKDDETGVIQENEKRQELEEQSKGTLEGNGTQEKEVSEDIPSFSEWAQKHLEEAEKREPANISTHQPQNTTKSGSGAKLRWKNYASLDCGAKVINANPEAQNTWAILSPSKDDYKLSPCNSRVWFIVELCEAIQVRKIDLANYELYASSPKDFVVSVSDRYPTRDWVLVGQFTAKDERDVQSYDLDHENFGKYVKIEIKSHYGSEHFCPMSLFRAYGTSVFEVLQKEDPANVMQTQDDLEEDDILEPGEQKVQTSGNLLSSATDAVISMVKKAAQVLGNKSNQSELTENKSHRSIMMQTCNSPSHYVVCNNCTDTLFGKIYEILSCKPLEVIKILKIPFVVKSMISSKICKKFGFDFRNKSSEFSSKSCPKCVESFFSEEHIGAMCNLLAVTFNKVLRNVSHQYANSSIKDEKLVDINSIASKNSSNLELKDKIVIEPTKTLDLDENIKIEPSEVNLDDSLKSESIRGDSNSKIEPSLVDIIDKNLEINKVIDSDNTLLPKVLEVPEILENLPNIEVIKENLEISDDNLDILLSNGDNANSPSSSTLSPSNVNPQAQKESVFLRLSNRIKALERNMSLSSQYLEELSKRYKRQVEEMQRNLDRTVKLLEETDQRNAERNRKMEERLEYLTNAIDSVLLERDAWRVIGSVLCVVLVTFLVFNFCSRRNKTRITKTDNSKTVNLSDNKKSSHHHHPVKIIVSSPCKRDKSLSKVKKKKKAHVVQVDPGLVTKKENMQFSPGSTSTRIWSETPNWVEGRRVIEDIPFVLEDSDNSTLEILPDPRVTLKIPQGMTFSQIPPNHLAATKDKLTIYADKIQVEKGNSNRQSPTATSKMNGNSVPNGEAGNGDGNTPKSAKKGFKRLFKRVMSKD